MKINAAYKCTQQELYAAGTLGWQNYQGNLPDFINHKGKYTQAFGDAALADLNIAKKMPDNQVRNSVPEKIRIELALLAAICVNDWKALKSYIADAFPKELQKVMLEAAGSRYYRRASAEGWAEMQALLICAAQFIDDNTNALSQGGSNMPATFPTKFTDDKTAFETTYTGFIAASQESTGGTSDKLTANNTCYDTLVKMLADGQVIYRTDDVKKELFVFETLLGYVRATPVSGLRIVAKEKITELPVAGVAVTAQPGNVQGSTDENGVLIMSLPEDTYTLIGILDGNEVFTEEVNIITGVVSRKTIELTKTA